MAALAGSWRVYLGDTLIATADNTALGELRAPKRRRRSAASRAFRRALHEVAAPPSPGRRERPGVSAALLPRGAPPPTLPHHTITQEGGHNRCALTTRNLRLTPPQAGVYFTR